MPATGPESDRLSFEPFELDLATGELRKDGLLIHLPPQPFKILALLAGRAGQLVTRENIQQQIWGSETFVDFDHGLNFAIKRIREALCDEVEHPRYIETLPRKGYRFIAPVEIHRFTAQPSTLPATASAPPLAPGPGGEAIGLKAPPPGLPLTGSGVTRRAFTVLLDSVFEYHRARRRWRRAAAGVGIVVGVAALLAVYNVAGLRDGLTTVGAGSARPREGVALPYPKIESIAVLPLENLSGDKEQEYFADGMTEELIANLGKISALRIISRTSVMQYKGTKKTLPQIARELNVDAVVEGSVLHSGSRVRITAKLLHAPADRQLWADSYESDVGDVLILQAEVARAIASEVKAKVTPDVQARLIDTRAVNPEALGLYLKGSDSLERGDTKKSLDYFQQAIQKDPNFARAYLGVAWVYGYFGRTDEIAAIGAFRKEKEFARRALDLDDSLDEAHAALAHALYQGDWDWSGAEREFKRALDINLNSQVAHSSYSWYLSLQGRPELALAEARRSLEISPLSEDPYYSLGGAYYFARRYDEALAQFGKVKSMKQNLAWFTPLFLGWAYREKGMYKDAIAEYNKIPRRVLAAPAIAGHLGNTYARAGDRAKARDIIRKLAERSAKSDTETYAVAIIYAGLAEKDQAFEWLDKAYKLRDKGLCYLKVDPTLDPLRSDPRFHDLLRRMNFPP